MSEFLVKDCIGPWGLSKQTKMIRENLFENEMDFLGKFDEYWAEEIGQTLIILHTILRILVFPSAHYLYVERQRLSSG